MVTSWSVCLKLKKGTGECNAGGNLRWTTCSIPSREDYEYSWESLHATETEIRSGGSFSKAPENFQARKAKVKSRTLGLRSCFIHIFLIWTEVHFIQEVSGVNTSPFLHTGERKMALRARKVSGTFEKQAPGLVLHLVHMETLSSKVQCWWSCIVL